MSVLRDDVGASVRILSGLTDSGWDLDVGQYGLSAHVEIKVPGQELKRGQPDYFAKWRGQPIFIWDSIEQAVREWQSYVRCRLR